MRNLTGYLKKIPLLFSLCFLLTSIQPISAETPFTISTDITHSIDEQNINTVIIATFSTNTTRVLSYYTATIPQENLNVECFNADTNKKLDCSSHKKNGGTDILVAFNNVAITSKAPYKLKIVYQTQNSNTNSYNIVSSINDTTTSNITIIYPKTKGEPLWSSDPIQNIKTVGDNYQVLIEKPVYKSFSLLFGKQVAYKFAISKTFANSENNKNQTFELVVPSDTATQTIVWENINPLPNITELDNDGNYVFKYIVSPNQTVDCTIEAYILKHDPYTDLDTPDLFLTNNTGYWNTTNRTEFLRINTYLVTKGLKLPEGFSNIQEVDKSTQELVYKYLYQYTVERLAPVKDLTNGIISDNRVGFDNLISNPVNATPADYSDYLITILRKYKIPARQIIGYISNISSYTSDGFYNYWVEAYDYTQSKWITLDPFLEDYFSKPLYANSFFDHIAVLARGSSPVTPKLTFYKDSDFKVNFYSQESVSPNFDPQAQLTFETSYITNKYFKTLVNITNRGNIAITGYGVSQSNISDIQKYLDPVNNINAQIILPKQSSTLQFNLPFQDNLVNSFINIKFTNTSFSKELLLEATPTITVPVYLQIITKVVSIAAFSGLVYFLYFFINKAIIKRRNG